MFWMDRHTKFALFLGVIINQGIFFSWFLIILKKCLLKKEEARRSSTELQVSCFKQKKSTIVIKQS